MHVLATRMHLLHLVVHELLVIVALLLALIDLPKMGAKLLHDLLESLSQVVDWLSHELAIDDLLLIELAPIRVSLRLSLNMLLLLLVLLIVLPSHPFLLVARLLVAAILIEGGSAALAKTKLSLLIGIWNLILISSVFFEEFVIKWVDFNV